MRPNRFHTTHLYQNYILNLVFNRLCLSACTSWIFHLWCPCVYIASLYYNYIHDIRARSHPAIATPTLTLPHSSPHAHPLSPKHTHPYDASMGAWYSPNPFRSWWTLSVYAPRGSRSRRDNPRHSDSSTMRYDRLGACLFHDACWIAPYISSEWK